MSSANSRTLKFFVHNHRIKVDRSKIRDSVHHEARVAVMFLSLSMLVKGAQSFSQFKDVPLARATQALFYLFLANHYRKNRKFIEQNGKGSTELVLQAVMKPGTEVVGGYYVYLYDTLVKRTILVNKKEKEVDDSFPIFVQQLIHNQDFVELAMPESEGGPRAPNIAASRKKGWEIMFNCLGSIRQYASAVDAHFNEVFLSFFLSLLFTLCARLDPVSLRKCCPTPSGIPSMSLPWIERFISSAAFWAGGLLPTPRMN